MERRLRRSKKMVYDFQFYVIGLLGFLLILAAGVVFGPKGYTNLARMSLIMYLGLLIWGLHYVLTGQVGRAILSDFFSLTLVYFVCIYFYAEGRFTTWVLTGCLAALLLIGIVYRYVGCRQKIEMQELHELDKLQRYQ